MINQFCAAVAMTFNDRNQTLKCGLIWVAMQTFFWDSLKGWLSNVSYCPDKDEMGCQIVQVFQLPFYSEVTNILC
jgi:hypothetical protein